MGERSKSPDLDLLGDGQGAKSCIRGVVKRLLVKRTRGRRLALPALRFRRVSRTHTEKRAAPPYRGRMGGRGAANFGRKRILGIRGGGT